ncbi:MAG: MFS transporter [Anaerolineales bacterium]|nr:MFS transporter [Anaerolineales bacterium]
MHKSSSAHRASSALTFASSHRLAVGLYLIIAFLYWASLYLYIPTLPTYIQGKVNDLALVGVILSMYGLWQAVIRLPLGIAADWLGWRKPFIIFCLALSGLGAWLIAQADSPTQLLVGRAVTGLAAGTWVPLVAVFSSQFPAHEAVRATAILTLVSSLGRMSATSLTGSLNNWGGYSLAFFLATGVAGLAILLVLPAYEQRRPVVRPSLGSTGRLITRRDVLLPAVLAAVGQYADWGITFGFMPILAKQLGGTGATQSLMVSMHLGVIALGNLAASALVNRVSSQRLVYFGFGVVALGIGLAALAPSLAVLFVAQFCLGLGQGMNGPVLLGLSIRYVADAERTTAVGLHQSVYAVGMFAGPWLSGILAEAVGLRPMFGVTACACLLVGLFIASRLAARGGNQSV